MLHLLIVAVLLMLSGSAEARTFWVSTSGNDSNGCTDSASPLTTTANRTITGSSGGIACLTQAGDVLMVGTGTYTTGEVSWLTSVRGIANGTASAYTKILGVDPNNPPIFQPTGNVGNESTGGGIRFDRSGGDSYLEIRNMIIDGTTQSSHPSGATGRGVWFGDKAHHIRMDNIKIRDFHETSPTAQSKSNGLMLTSGAHHIHVSNCEIYNNGNSVRQGAHNVYWAGDDSILEDCSIHDPVGNFNGQFFASSDGTGTGEQPHYKYPERTIIRRNIFDMGASTGDRHNVVIEGKNNEFYENVIIGKSTVGGYCLGLGYGPDTAHTLVYNNVMYGCQNEGILVGTYVGGSLSYSRIKNNLIMNAGGAPILVTGPTTNNTEITYNTFFGNGNSDIIAQSNGETGTVRLNNTATNPLFTNASAGDFTLQGGSPALNSGTATICTAADVSAGKCASVVTLTFVDAGKDRGRWEAGTPAPAGGLVSRYLLNNNTNDAESGLTGTPLSIVYETTSPTPAEGTHSAKFNGTTSYVSAPSTGLTITAQTRCGAWNADVLTGIHAIWMSRTINPSANRDGLRHNGTALVVEMGNAGTLPTSATLATGEWGYACLVRSGSGGNGTWRVVYRNPSTHVLSTVGSGTYASLTQLPSVWTIGNFNVGDGGGFNGNVDDVKTYNIALTDAEILADCELTFGAGQCSAIVPPTFVAPDLASGTNNTTGLQVTATFASGPVDPALCLVPENFILKYDTVPQAWGACSINGLIMTLNPVPPPPSGSAAITLENTAQDSNPDVDETITITNLYNPPVTTANLVQAPGACRFDGRDDSQVWESACDMPANGWREFRTPINNTGGTVATEQAYALYCSRSNPVVAETRVTEDCTTPLGFCYKPILSGENGIGDGQAVVDHVMIGAGTYQAGGVLRRTEATVSQVAIDAGKHVEMAWIVKKSPTVALGDVHSCVVKTDAGGALSGATPVISNTVRPGVRR